MLGEAKNLASTTKEKARLVKVWASKTVMGAVEAFKVGEQYR